jgi:hypothetical protein
MRYRTAKPDSGKFFGRRGAHRLCSKKHCLPEISGGVAGIDRHGGASDVAGIITE